MVPRAASLRADLIATDRAIEEASARILDSGEGLLGATTEKARQARVKVIASDLFDLKAELKAELEEVEGLLYSARYVRDELRSAFEEVSRSLASVELEYRIERSAP